MDVKIHYGFFSNKQNLKKKTEKINQCSIWVLCQGSINNQKQTTRHCATTPTTNQCSITAVGIEFLVKVHTHTDPFNFGQTDGHNKVINSGPCLTTNQSPQPTVSNIHSLSWAGRRRVCNPTHPSVTKKPFRIARFATIEPTNAAAPANSCAAATPVNVVPLSRSVSLAWVP